MLCVYSADFYCPAHVMCAILPILFFVPYIRVCLINEPRAHIYSAFAFLIKSSESLAAAVNYNRCKIHLSLTMKISASSRMFAAEIYIDARWYIIAFCIIITTRDYTLVYINILSR